MLILDAHYIYLKNLFNKAINMPEPSYVYLLSYNFFVQGYFFKASKDHMKGD